MKRLLCLVFLLVMVSTVALADTNKLMRSHMPEPVPVWTEETVTNYALEFISGKHMEKLYDYYDLQIRRYLSPYAFESMLTDLTWMTGAFVGLGTYSQFEEPELGLKTHVLHLCMEKQDLDLYFVHKNYEYDWEVMALEFIPSEKQAPIATLGEGLDMKTYATLYSSQYEEYEITVGTDPFMLGGTLTMPKEASPENKVPACLLIHDSNALDRNGTMGNTTVFSDIAHTFAQMGIATLRYDSRDFVYGAKDDDTIYDEVVFDAIEAGKLLATNPNIDTTNITAIGLGVGGSLTPRIVYQSNNIFTAMILIGAYPTTILEQHFIAHETEIALMDTEERNALKYVVSNFSKTDENEIKDMDFWGKKGSYYQEMAPYSAIKLIRNMRIPTFIAQGLRDPMVSKYGGITEFYEEIRAGGNMEYHSFRKLNHILMSDATVNALGIPTYAVPSTLDIHAGRMIAEWIIDKRSIDYENQ